MKKLYHVLLISIVFIFITTSVSAQTEWQTYQNNDIGFAISLPDKPETRQKSNENMKIHQMSANENGCAYKIYATQYSGRMDKYPELLDTSIETFVGSFAGKPEKTEDFIYNGFKGKRVYFKNSANSKIIYSVVYIGNYGFQMIAMSGKEYISEEKQEKFFNSFKIIP